MTWYTIFCPDCQQLAVMKLPARVHRKDSIYVAGCFCSLILQSSIFRWSKVPEDSLVVWQEESL